MFGVAGCANGTAIAKVQQDPAVDGYFAFLDWRTRNFGGSDWFQRTQLLAEAGQLNAAEAALRKSYLAREPHLIRLRTEPRLSWSGIR